MNTVSHLQGCWGQCPIQNAESVQWTQTVETGVGEHFRAGENSQEISLREESGLQSSMQHELILDLEKSGRIYIEMFIVVISRRENYR